MDFYYITDPYTIILSNDCRQDLLNAIGHKLTIDFIYKGVVLHVLNVPAGKARYVYNTGFDVKTNSGMICFAAAKDLKEKLDMSFNYMVSAMCSLQPGQYIDIDSVPIYKLVKRT